MIEAEDQNILKGMCLCVCVPMCVFFVAQAARRPKTCLEGDLNRDIIHFAPCLLDVFCQYFYLQ